ncbi:MAG: AAA family ATPase [Alphaproteobacteria bacterium]|nr:AAA family ATPase [Alphaproteobacteria bacterium]
MIKNDQNNLICIYSGTKGIGKTWFASILSQFLGLKKQKVLFFDADGSIENIACQLGLKKSDLYLKMLKNRLTLNNAVIHYTKGRFDIIYVGEKETPLAAYPAGRCQILACDLKKFASYYQRVVIDCAETNPTLTNMCLHLSDKIILLVEPNMSGLTEAYKALEHIKRVSPHAKIFIVINHALSQSEGEQVYKTILSADKQFISASPKLLGVINQDGRIRDCVLNKTTLFERYPVCQSLSEIDRISTFLINGDEQNAL